MAKNSRHPDRVVGYKGSLGQLARAIGNMKYDKVALFIGKFADDIKRQADADSARGRKKVPKDLSGAARNLNQARKKIESAWKTCKPYMVKD